MRLIFTFVDGSKHTIVIPDVATAESICDSITGGMNVQVTADDGVFVAVARNVIRVIGENV